MGASPAVGVAVARELTPAEVQQIEAMVREAVPPPGDGQVAPDELIPCDGCYRQRPVQNFRLYNWWHLCVDCAIEFELALAGEEVRNISDFLAQKVLYEELSEDFQF